MAAMATNNNHPATALSLLEFSYTANEFMAPSVTEVAINTAKQSIYVQHNVLHYKMTYFQERKLLQVVGFTTSQFSQ